MTPKPNPCTTPTCGKAVPDVSTDHAGVGMVRCSTCLKAEWGNDRDHAVTEWNIAHPRPIRWLYIIGALCLAGGVLCIALALLLIGG